MGLTVKSVGRGARDSGLQMERKSKNTHVIALAGNPNVGKSTVFNALTGMHQHTGNWPGKTVSGAEGAYTYKGEEYILVDVPGAYSLMAHSKEEEVARDFICFGGADAVVVVTDATCLERNLNLVLQILETTQKAVVCVNLMDEAKKKQIRVDLKALEKYLGVPVVGASAGKGKGLSELRERIAETVEKEALPPYDIPYNDAIEKVLKPLTKEISPFVLGKLNPRWAALRLLEGDESLNSSLKHHLALSEDEGNRAKSAVRKAKNALLCSGIGPGRLRDLMVFAIYNKAEEIAHEAVCYDNQGYNHRQLKIDRILTNKWTGIPIMLLFLAAIFWITISAANVPSELLSKAFFWLGDRISEGLLRLHTPLWLHDVLVEGIYRVLAWVVSVMLPPMAIFFPLFTLLEDLGYLPRIAFNLDSGFKRCCACGKQALTMCMVVFCMRFFAKA